MLTLHDDAMGGPSTVAGHACETRRTTSILARRIPFGRSSPGAAYLRYASQHQRTTTRSCARDSIYGVGDTSNMAAGTRGALRLALCHPSLLPPSRCGLTPEFRRERERERAQHEIDRLYQLWLDTSAAALRDATDLMSCSTGVRVLEAEPLC